MKRDAKHAEAMRLIFKQNWSPGSTARHLDMTLEELLELLEVDIETEDADEKEKVPDTTSVEIEDKKNNFPEVDDKEKDKKHLDDKE